ncbi:RNA ligase/cyclic nucleotide phosphodiesterase [Mycena belliarum]|uniref:RNA ligase/cyclic nucleotide phosphodiesterase n=1 Tax=Mycena belliarum TaxID=1033014 RepID=A0AAD6XNB9_9AGAR|nr:RNA ligase/cyclic nucleotide phosphodiesterase [Mycena belliae]
MPNETLNPFNSLLENSEFNSDRIQARYANHRAMRNAEQTAKFLSTEFEGVSIDPILLRLEDQSVEPGFVDTRNAMVFIARPPEKITKLIRECQEKLREVVPDLWIVPQTSLHMTALEIAHSRSVDEIASLVEQLRDAAPSIVNYPRMHRTRLVKPLLCFDTSAFALSFLPVADTYTYHHFRRDLFDIAHKAGAELQSRYVFPSAHLTVGRFIRPWEGSAPALVARIEEINAWLKREFWPEGDRATEWVVGDETGLEWRTGPVWYGSGGETLLTGDV